MKTRRTSFLLLLLTVSVPLCSTAQSQDIGIKNSSDWWSYLRLEETPPSGAHGPVSFQNRVPAPSTFRIAGLTIGLADIQQIRARFGDAAEVSRGDAASGRQQICYASPSGSIHLIFEWGEVESILYLFEGGPQWDGMNYCASSSDVSEHISTASGLRIGLSPEQVKTILGTPSIITPHKQVYYFGYRIKTSAEELVRLRKQNSTMNEKEFRESFNYLDGEAYIEARFVSDKLNYLAISRSETY
jgi:hypothetical protein